MALVHVDLFSGIGGFALAANWAGFETVVFCEKDKYCQKVLKKHWPDVPIIEDIHEFNGKDYPNTTLLTGGFPCQPFSIAGKRKGNSDNRALWPQMFRIIQESKPTWVIGENVIGFTSLGFDETITDLESEGYKVITFNIPACACDAPHIRQRLWIVAHSNRKSSRMEKYRSCRQRRENPDILQPEVLQQKHRESCAKGITTDGCDVPNNNSPRELQQKGIKSNEWGWISDSSWWSPEPNVGRVAHGIPSRVDRLKALGNAIVPQVAYQILKGIAEIEK
jgi:DNA (cytosine-5)-methyltransferase 1